MLHKQLHSIKRDQIRPVVDVDDGEHVPLPGSELVLDAVLVPLALHLHRGQDEATADEVSRITDTFCRLETEKGLKKLIIIYFLLPERKVHNF
jgi:hypothetical protein